LEFDYVLDCIDSVDAKTKLSLQQNAKGVKIISSMGADGKMEASKVKRLIQNTVNCFLPKPFADA
jgi:tRNA A37 threonylcarbamoyladenosine dehydratase